MSLTKEQIEEIKLDMAPDAFTTLALCDMALQSLEAHELVRELRDELEKFRFPVQWLNEKDTLIGTLEKADRWLGK